MHFKNAKKDDPFVDITKETNLGALDDFFNHNYCAFVVRAQTLWPTHRAVAIACGRCSLADALLICSRRRRAGAPLARGRPPRRSRLSSRRWTCCNTNSEYEKEQWSSKVFITAVRSFHMFTSVWHSTLALERR